MKIFVAISLILFVLIGIDLFYQKSPSQERLSDEEIAALVNHPMVKESLKRLADKSRLEQTKSNKIAVAKGFTHLCIAGSDKGHAVKILESQDHNKKRIPENDPSAPPPTYYVVVNDVGVKYTVELLDFFAEYKNIDPKAYPR